MNWLLIAVILVLAWNIVRGYTKGLLRIVYSIAAWLIILVLATFSTPYVADFLTDHTAIETKIEEKTHEKLSEAFAEDEESASAPETHTEREALEELGIKLPKSLADKIFEETGVYNGISKKISSLAVTGISFVLLLIIIALIFTILFQVLKLIEKLPVIEGINRALGVIVGALKGIIIIWIIFAIIAVNSTTSFGIMMVSYIYESPLLEIVYENNAILSLVLLFI